MSAPVPRPRAAGDAPWWQFRPAYLPFDPQKRERFGERLLEALRSAAGLGVAPILRWETGPEARFLLGGSDPATRGWIGRVLVPCYPPGLWHIASAGPGSAGPDRSALLARPTWPAPAPYRSCLDPVAFWADTVAPNLLGLPAGSSLEWRLYPPQGQHPSPRLPWPPALEPVRVDPGSRLAPISRVERDLRDRAAEAERSPRWTILGELRGPHRSGRERLARLVAESSAAVGGNAVRFVPRGRLWPRSPSPVALTEPELAAFFPSPWARLPGRVGLGEPSAPGLRVGVAVGEGPAHLPMPPDEGRHLLITGESGMGKSTALVGLAVAATALAGVILLDPVGDTARRFLAGLPAAARARVLWISPVDSPVGLNLVAHESSEPGASERRNADLVAALRRVREGRYPERSFWGPRVEETVARALFAASRLPGGTVEDALALLESPGRAVRQVPQEARPAVERLRRQVLEQPDEVDGGRRLLDEVVRNPLLRRMLCCRSPKLSVQGLVGRQGITVVSGDAPRAGETAARGLLALLLALLSGELLAREAPAAKVVLALDEVQWYAHDAVAELARLGRRANVHLWAATQSIASLREDLREALLTNAADLIAFRGSANEARELTRVAPGVEAELLTRMPRGSAAFLRGKGSEVGFVTLQPPPRREDGGIALTEVLDRARPYWAEAPAGSDDAGTESGSSGRTVPREPLSNGDEAVRRVLLVLWAGLQDTRTDLLVPLADLRAEVDPEGAAVRAAGARLRDAGCLMDREATARGTEWRVRREGFSALLGGPVPPEELRWASGLWERVAARRGLRGAGQAF